jgi:CrcB protein
VAEDLSVEYGLVAVGGSSGALLRWGIGFVFPAYVGTLTVNVLGALLLGVLTTSLLERSDVATHTRRLAATGFLSSFTTYSAFALEATFASGLEAMALYVGATYGFGLLGAAIGRSIGRTTGGTIQ